MYWCCAQVEPRRERLASYTLGLAGYEIYQPLLREQRRGSHGRKITVTPPLFPGYLFLWVVSGWWDARPARPERRPAATSRQSLQACIASLPLQSSWMSKTYLKSDHFNGGGSCIDVAAQVTALCLMQRHDLDCLERLPRRPE
jgi:hypothetical protein